MAVSRESLRRLDSTPIPAHHMRSHIMRIPPLISAPTRKARPWIRAKCRLRAGHRPRCLQLGKSTTRPCPWRTLFRRQQRLPAPALHSTRHFCPSRPNRSWRPHRASTILARKTAPWASSTGCRAWTDYGIRSRTAWSRVSCRSMRKTSDRAWGCRAGISRSTTCSIQVSKLQLSNPSRGGMSISSSPPIRSTWKRSYRGLQESKMLPLSRPLHESCTATMPIYSRYEILFQLTVVL